MTTELPSGETFTAVKLIELKNSSNVSLGFAVWAWATTEWEITDTREISTIDRPIELSITVFKNYDGYTASAVGGKDSQCCFYSVCVCEEGTCVRMCTRSSSACIV